MPREAPKRKKRNILKWGLLIFMYLYAFAYMIFVWLHRYPKNELLLRSIKK